MDSRLSCADSRLPLCAMALPEDDEQQPPAAHPTDADIAAVCALCAARGEAPAPLGLPKSAELRARRAAARAREAVQRRKATQRQVVAYLELLDENGALGMLLTSQPVALTSVVVNPQTAAPVLKLLYVILYASSLASIALLVVAFGLQARGASACSARRDP